MPGSWSRLWSPRWSRNVSVVPYSIGLPGEVGAASDADELVVEQCPQRLAASDAADGFDVGTQHRLAVGDDRERLPESGAEATWPRLAGRVSDERVVGRQRQDLPAAGGGTDAERSILLRVSGIQRRDGPCDFLNADAQQVADEPA